MKFLPVATLLIWAVVAEAQRLRHSHGRARPAQEQQRKSLTLLLAQRFLVLLYFASWLTPSLCLSSVDTPRAYELEDERMTWYKPPGWNWDYCDESCGTNCGHW